MPDTESKKNQQKKGKHEAKEQRKPRQQRNQGSSENKSSKRTEEPQVVVPEKQALEEPGPEFYKGLKRETDDILKITEDANSKYKKKEIKSNWSQYELPIDSYDDIEEQENLGADYEKLIQTPMSLGGHFQFKHEKSWDITTGPSLYDKYFDITGNDLATALCTIPFYERNGIDKTIFTETDIQTMEQRTSRYKHKYYKIATVESEIQDKLINNIKEDFSKTDETDQSTRNESEVDKNNDISLEDSKLNITEQSPGDQVEIVFKRTNYENKAEPIVNNEKKSKEREVDDDIDDIIVEPTKHINLNKKTEVIKAPPERKVISKATPADTETRIKPVIESPEDLEKWLDDFLEE